MWQSLTENEMKQQDQCQGTEQKQVGEENKLEKGTDWKQWKFSWDYVNS
jgi:hypothetical protein